MGIIGSAFDALSDTLADQWKEIVTVEPFDARTALAPGVLKRTNRGRGANVGSSDGIRSDSVESHQMKKLEDSLWNA